MKNLDDFPVDWKRDVYNKWVLWDEGKEELRYLMFRPKDGKDSADVRIDVPSEGKLLFTVLDWEGSVKFSVPIAVIKKWIKRHEKS